jgi:hypothetical protein
MKGNGQRKRAPRVVCRSGGAADETEIGEERKALVASASNDLTR